MLYLLTLPHPRPRRFAPTEWKRGLQRQEGASIMEPKPQSWQEWLVFRQAASMMTVARIPLTEVRGWGMQQAGDFARPDGKFWALKGVQVSLAGREVSTWDQPLIEEYGQGVVVLVIDPTQDRFLLRAKAEPGNAALGCVALAPTIQCSQSNLTQVHGGKRPPRVELLDGKEIDWIRILQDGGKFYCKLNIYHILYLSHEEVGVLSVDERWFTRREIQEAFLAGVVNSHLAEVLGLLI